MVIRRLGNNEGSTSPQAHHHPKTEVNISQSIKPVVDKTKGVRSKTPEPQLSSIPPPFQKNYDIQSSITHVPPGIKTPPPTIAPKPKSVAPPPLAPKPKFEPMREPAVTPQPSRPIVPTKPKLLLERGKREASEHIEQLRKQFTREDMTREEQCEFLHQMIDSYAAGIEELRKKTGRAFEDGLTLIQLKKMSCEEFLKELEHVPPERLLLEKQVREASDKIYQKIENQAASKKVADRMGFIQHNIDNCKLITESSNEKLALGAKRLLTKLHPLLMKAKLALENEQRTQRSEELAKELATNYLSDINEQLRSLQKPAQRLAYLNQIKNNCETNLNQLLDNNTDEVIIQANLIILQQVDSLITAESPSTIKGVIPTGVPSIGNSCYLASMLQVCAQIPLYQSAFDLARNPLSQNHLVGETAIEFAARQELQKLIHTIIGRLSKGISPTQEPPMKDLITELSLALAKIGILDPEGPFEQYDSAEVLSLLLDHFQFSSRTNITYDERRNFDAAEATPKPDKNPSGYSPLEDLTKTTQDTVNNIGFILDASKSFTSAIEGELKTSQESLHAVRKGTVCEFKGVRVEKQLRQLPQTIMISAQDRDMSTARKNDVTDIPLLWTPPGSQDRYRLAAIIYKAGAARSGHYFAFINKAEKSDEARWIKCDDGRVSETAPTAAEISRARAYFYEKI